MVKRSFWLRILFADFFFQFREDGSRPRRRNLHKTPSTIKSNFVFSQIAQLWGFGDVACFKHSITINQWTQTFCVIIGYNSNEFAQQTFESFYGSFKTFSSLSICGLETFVLVQKKPSQDVSATLQRGRSHNRFQSADETRSFPSPFLTPFGIPSFRYSILHHPHHIMTSLRMMWRLKIIKSLSMDAFQVSLKLDVFFFIFLRSLSVSHSLLGIMMFLSHSRLRKGFFMNDPETCRILVFVSFSVSPSQLISCLWAVLHVVVAVFVFYMTKKKSLAPLVCARNENENEIIAKWCSRFLAEFRVFSHRLLLRF